MTPGIQIYTTEGLLPRHRVAYWNDCIGNHITSIDTRADDVRSFTAQLIAADCASIAIAEAASTPACNRHSRSLVSRSTERAFLLHLQRTGESVTAQDGREVLLRPGDFTLCDSGREFRVSFREPHRILVVRIPEKELTRRLPRVEDLTCVHTPHDAGINGIVSRLIARYWKLCRSGIEPLLANRICGNVLDLLATAYSSMHEARVAETSWTTCRRLLIREFIEQNLGLPDLTPSVIARRFGYTRSYIHQLFSAGGESICQYISRRRLEEAAKLLSSAAFDNRPIGDIACDWGFVSLTHFGRAFKAHYGVTPSEYRQRNRRDSPV